MVKATEESYLTPGPSSERLGSLRIGGGLQRKIGRDLDQPITFNNTGDPRVKRPVLKLIVESRTVTHSGSG